MIRVQYDVYVAEVRQQCGCDMYPIQAYYPVHLFLLLHILFLRHFN